VVAVNFIKELHEFLPITISHEVYAKSLFDSQKNKVLDMAKVTLSSNLKVFRVLFYLVLILLQIK
jgi:hypothetical protein